ncbi:MAG: FG-GAP-like repeat-containing protein, partial [Anaerolineae bacterium]
MSIKPRALTISKLVLLMGVASSWNTVFAQTPQIVDFLPQRYSMQNSTTAGVSVSFDQAMDGGTVLPENFLVYGSRTGYHAGTLVYDASAQTANFDPATPFQAGEVVTVVLTSGIQGSSGAPLSAPFQWSFYIQAVTGTATFNLDSTYAAGDGPHFVGIGDLNGDSALDLAIPNSRSHDVFSWLNLGGAGFNQHNINGVGQSPRALTVGDFDSDGDLDIAAANEVSSSVSLLNNDGAGVFTPRDTTLPVGGAPEHISNADLNGDGFLDLVTVDTDSNAISVLLNLGDGNFQSAVSYPVGARPQASFIADFNNDGFPDIVGSNLDDNNVSLLMNDGTGAFGPAQNFAVGVRPRAVQGHDFNQDGLVDLAVANRTDNTIAILLNLGSGTFSPPNNFPVGQDPFSMSVGDLEGDLDADLVVSNRLSNDFYVLLNNGFGIFQIDSVYTTGSQPRGLNAGDFNGDGVLDIGVVNWGTDSLQIFLNTLLPNQAPGSPVLLAPNDLSFMNPNATPIVLSWTVPVDTDGDVLHFKIEIDDNSDFSSPTLTFDSAVDATGFTPTPPVDSNTASVAYDLTTPVADGLYWWRVTASDGQVSGAPSPARSLTVDSTSPVISAVVIHNPDFAPNWYNQGTTTAIDFGAVYDELNADKAQFNLGALGGVEEIQNIPSGLDQVTQKTVALSSAPDGAYTLSVTIFDQAGNQTDTNTTIALDGTPPTSTQASSPARSSQETFQVKWDGSGTDGNGSGLSGLYDVQVQVDGGAWTPWLTNFQGTSSQYQGAHGSTYAFEVAAHDNLGNIETFLGIAETVTIVDTTNDVTAPGPPVTLTASGSSPSPWQNAPDFQIVWQEPSEQSGIARALYKLGGAPVADFDTTGSVSGATSVTITATQENGQGFYLWFSDLNGNVDFQNRAAVTLRYDNTPPSGTLAGSPAISAEESFEVQWDGSGTDGNGSGLSGFYDVRVQVDGGIWTPWLTNFQGTSASYPGVHGETYGFEAAAHDAADNVEAFLAISETQTVVDTNANDTAAPGPPPLLTAGGLSPSRWQNSPVFQISWQEAADTSGLARALYKLGSAPTANFDTTGSVTSATSLIIMVAQEDGQNFYLWFEDQRGNVDFQNHAVLQLRYDSTLPDLVELDILNADFGPDWFNQGSSNVATVEIN